MTGAEQARVEISYRSRVGRFVVTATVLGSGLALLDSTVVSIALPVIGRDFRANVGELQWVVSAYLLSLSGLVLFGGALGDRYGRRRIFCIGIVGFAVSSVACGLSPNIVFLIVFRSVQGAASALVTPVSLAILQAVFRPSDRALAIGRWSSLGGLATAIGPFAGGYLITAVSWRLIFFINLPFSLAALMLALRHVPETADSEAVGHVDLLGALFATAGLTGLTYGLIEGPSTGWLSPEVLALFAVGVVSFSAFVHAELHGKQPLLPLDIFASSQFRGTNYVTFFVYGALGGTLFLVPIELEEVARYSPLFAGASTLPITALMLGLSARSGRLSQRIGPRYFLVVGPIVLGVGIALLVRINAAGDYFTEVLPAVIFIGLGLATTVAPLTAGVLAAAPSRHSGAASAVNNDVARAASLVAVAVLPAAAGLRAMSYEHPNIFEGGFRRAVVITAATACFGGIVALFSVRNLEARRLAEASETSPEP